MGHGRGEGRGPVCQDNTGAYPRPVSFILFYFIFFSSTSLLLPTRLPPPSCTHAQSCNPMDFSPPDSSVHRYFSRQEYWSGLPFPSPGQSPLNGNSSPHFHIQPRESSSVNDHFISWKPHCYSPFSPQDHSPGQTALENSLQRTLEHSYLDSSCLSACQSEGLSEMNKDLSSWSERYKEE